jgi:hypothetical protein
MVAGLPHHSMLILRPHQSDQCRTMRHPTFLLANGPLFSWFRVHFTCSFFMASWSRSHCWSLYYIKIKRYSDAQYFILFDALHRRETVHSAHPQPTMQQCRFSDLDCTIHWHTGRIGTHQIFFCMPSGSAISRYCQSRTCHIAISLPASPQRHHRALGNMTVQRHRAFADVATSPSASTEEHAPA